MPDNPDMINIPAEFKYKEVFLKGRPCHDRHSPFYAKHPPMPAGRWAKIFAPFDALKWFDERIAEKEIVYTEKRQPEDAAICELNKRLEFLKDFTRNRRAARQNQIRATVTYFAPCTDRNSESYGRQGTYIHRTGIVWKVDTEADRNIQIDDSVISIDDIVKIKIE